MEKGKNSIITAVFILILLFFSFSAKSQNLSYEKTVEYINEKINTYEVSELVYKKQIMAKKDGNIEKRFTYNDGSQINQVNIKDVTITLSKFNNSHILTLKCLPINKLCTNYYYLDNDLRRRNQSNEIYLSLIFINYNEAEKVKKAFTNLQNLAKKQRPL